MDLISGCTCATRAAFCAGVKKSADTSDLRAVGGHADDLRRAHAQRGVDRLPVGVPDRDLREGHVGPRRLARGAPATSLASTVLKRLEQRHARRARERRHERAVDGRARARRDHVEARAVAQEHVRAHRVVDAPARRAPPQSTARATCASSLSDSGRSIV